MVMSILQAIIYLSQNLFIYKIISIFWSIIILRNFHSGILFLNSEIIKNFFQQNTAEYFCRLRVFCMLVIFIRKLKQDFEILTCIFLIEIHNIQDKMLHVYLNSSNAFFLASGMDNSFINLYTSSISARGNVDGGGTFILGFFKDIIKK